MATSNPLTPAPTLPYLRLHLLVSPEDVETQEQPEVHPLSCAGCWARPWWTPSVPSASRFVKRGEQAVARRSRRRSSATWLNCAPTASSTQPA